MNQNLLLSLFFLYFFFNFKGAGSENERHFESESDSDDEGSKRRGKFTTERTGTISLVSEKARAKIPDTLGECSHLFEIFIHSFYITIQFHSCMLKSDAKFKP